MRVSGSSLTVSASRQGTAGRVGSGAVVNEPLAIFVYRFFTVSSHRRSEPNVDKLRLCA